MAALASAADTGRSEAVQTRHAHDDCEGPIAHRVISSPALDEPAFSFSGLRGDPENVFGLD
jgi:hypothetical protein